MIIVSKQNIQISSYLFESFAFMNQDIDSNYHQNLKNKLEKLETPYTQRTGFLNNEEKITLIDKQKKIQIFQSTNK